MSFETIVFLAGCALLVVGLSGGKVRIKDWLEADGVSPAARGSMALIGSVLIVASFGQLGKIASRLEEMVKKPHPSPTPVVTSSPTPPVTAAPTSPGIDAPTTVVGENPKEPTAPGSDKPAALRKAPVPSPPPSENTTEADSRTTGMPTMQNSIDRVTGTSATTSPQATPSQTPQARTVAIYCALKSGEEEETVRVAINGSVRFTCSVNSQKRESGWTTTIKGGDSYTLSGDSSWKDTSPGAPLIAIELREITGQGVFSNNQSRARYLLQKKGDGAQSDVYELAAY